MRLAFFALMIFLNYSIVSHAQMECPVDKIYPQSDDFSGDDCGRILISKPTGSFYTPYQTEESEVRIKAVLSSEYIGQVVYFRIIDPDDMSPYETVIDGDDNGDKTGYRLIENNTTVNVIDAQNHIYSTVAVSGTGAENGIAVAEVILKFTDYYSGDNYKVLCNTDPLVPIGNSAETICMVAWKRMKIETVKMYDSGTCLIQDSDGSNTLRVMKFPEGELVQGDIITIKSPPNIIGQQQVTYTATIQQVIHTSESFLTDRIILDDLQGIIFPRWSAVYIENAELPLHDYNINEQYLASAYGDSDCGIHGGVFVEFEIQANEAHIIPQFDFFLNQDLNSVNSIEFFDFIEDWNGSSNNSNTAKLTWSDTGPRTISNNGVEESRRVGITDESTNNSMVFLSNIIGATIQQSDVGIGNENERVNNTVIHELAHQYDVNPLTNPHVDSHNNSHVIHTCSNQPGDCPDQCVMSYRTQSQNTIFEFDIGATKSCIESIRSADNPQ